MSDDGTTFFPYPIGTELGAKIRARFLLAEIEQHHGKRVARRIFRKIIGPESKKARDQWRDWILLARLDGMPKRHISQLARSLAVEKYGEHATSQQVETERKQIKRLIKKREKAIKAGTWHAPGTITSAVVRIKVL